MWRAFFSAVGIVLLILGIECLLIEQAILSNGAGEQPIQQQIQAVSLFGGSSNASFAAPSNKIFRPAEWIPWSLLATGAITVLYSASYRRT